jgi:hypothetical protein
MVGGSGSSKGSPNVDATLMKQMVAEVKAFGLPVQVNCNGDYMRSTRSMQPSFLMNHLRFYGGAYRDQIFGPERAAFMDPPGPS